MRIESASCGLAAEIPTGWWARIWGRGAPDPKDQSAPTLHAANFSLPIDGGSFGFSVIIPSMNEFDAFLCLVEIASPESSRKGQYGTLPRSFETEDFDQSWLTSSTAHMLSRQYFCALEGRAFCLFSVFGSRATLLETRADAIALVRGIEVVPAEEFYAA